ncbi:MAG TPA: TetR/AcrR family transcriptional regulator, partial [Chroococcidiopsis sp.]
LASPGDAPIRLQQMCDRLYELYEGGTQPCLFAILQLGSARDVFHEQVKILFLTWIDAIAQVLIEAGLEPTLAHERGQDGAIAIQGALILSQALSDPAPFQRIVRQLPSDLCRP